MGHLSFYNKNQIRDKLLMVLIFFANNEPKFVLARDLGDCRSNYEKLASVFLIVGAGEVAKWQGYGIGLKKQYYMLRNAEDAALCVNITMYAEMMGH